MGTGLEIALVAAAAGGTLLQAKSQMDAGKAAKKMGEYTAEEARIKAIQAQAVGQRKAAEQRRQANLVGSKLQAQAAAGGGATDPTILKLQEDIAGEGEYRALTDLYESEVQSNDLITQGNMARYEGNLKNKAGKMNAMSTILSFGGDMYSKYGMGGGTYNSSTGSAGASSSRFRSGETVKWYG